jgi:hypothetical protein
MKTRSHSDIELCKAAEHVCYEIEMLFYAAEHLGGYHSPPVSVPGAKGKHMALESFLLHFRNLRAFLCPTTQPTHDDDIIGSDFLKSPQPQDYGNWAKLGIDKKRLDQMLSHLSYNRVARNVDMYAGGTGDLLCKSAAERTRVVSRF